MMRIIVKEPGQWPEVRQVKPEEVRTIIGGDADVALRAVGIFPGFFEIDDDLVVLCHGDGLALELPHNFDRPTDNHPVVGTVVLVKRDTQGEDVSMTVSEAQDAMSWFSVVLLEDEVPTRHD